LQYAFCLEMLYTEFSFPDRLTAAKQDGIEFFEFWDWRNKDPENLKNRSKELNLQVTNMSGNRSYGMIDPAERQFLFSELTETCGIARLLDCPRLMLLVQSLLSTGEAKPASENLSYNQKIDRIIECAISLGAMAEKQDIDIVIEPLNSVLDHPGYFLDSSEVAFRIIGEINHPRIKILYDVYHMSVMGENVLKDLEMNLDLIGYIHTADKPGRNEPGSGDIDYKRIFALLHNLDFSGMIGFECYASGGNSRQAVQDIMKLISW
jgi:hydroxypyruvate isomerase